MGTGSLRWHRRLQEGHVPGSQAGAAKQVRPGVYSHCPFTRGAQEQVSALALVEPLVKGCHADVKPCI